MIYLITGNMGTGKTSRAVNMILTNEDGLFKQTIEDGTVIDRPLYFCHIDGLDAAKFNAHEITKEQIQSAPLDEILPTGAILIVDEAHWTYPVRSSAKAVPPYIQKLSELRHDGFTLILLTQHPSQLDIFVRNLVSKHIHLERKSLGMKQYWWYKCVTNLDNPAAVSGVESSSFKPPSEAFKYYKSSSQHQKFKKKIPVAVWLLVFILAFTFWKGYNLYGAYSKSVNNEPQIHSDSTDIQTADSLNKKSSVSVDDNKMAYSKKLTPDLYMPTMAEKPESKPLYDDVRQVRQYERISACIKGGLTGCTCYSDQATRLKEITVQMCMYYVQNGLPFDPFREPEKSAPYNDKTVAEGSAVNQQVAQLGGKTRPSLHDGDSAVVSDIQ